jgi:hypothetical protein|tara:strand:+ start:316 stop:600 length:285 start_codon:yes stop_codon:yes gene_type:complete
MSNEQKTTKNVIPNYEITFSAKNVTPKQRDIFWNLLSEAYDNIAKALSVKDADNTSLGETKVSETDWSSPSNWSVGKKLDKTLQSSSYDWSDKL